jgi:hypothetical protein
VYEPIPVKEVDCEKANCKETDCEKKRSVARLNATPIPAPPAPFWNRWTFRVLVGGVVAVVIGAYTMVNLPAICPPGTVICHHGPGTVTLDHDLFANVGRVLGMEGEGNVSVSHTEVQNAPIP